MSPSGARPLAELPRYVDEHSKWIIEIPIRIAVILVAAWLIRFMLHRAINRLSRPLHPGEMPRILRPFKDKVENHGLILAPKKVSERRNQRAATIGSVLKSLVSAVVWVIALLEVLGELGVNLAPLVAGTSIVGVALGFGAQSLVKDFLSGMFMMLEDQYGVGDWIDFELASGTVEAVGLRTTRLRDSNGTVWYVRNGEVLRVGNMSQDFGQALLDVPVSAATDVDAAMSAMLEVATALANEDEWKDVFVSAPEVWGVQAMTRWETVIRLAARVRPMQQWKTERELRRRIRERLDQLGMDARPPIPPDRPVPPPGKTPAPDTSGAGSQADARPAEPAPDSRHQ